VIDERESVLHRLRRAESLERAMLALRDARETCDVLVTVARFVGREFRRPCVAFEAREGGFRPVVAPESPGAVESPEISARELDALRVRGLIRKDDRDYLGISSDGQLRALIALDASEEPLDDDDTKFLRALGAHVALALANALGFDQLRRHAAEGAALTDAARTILGFTELEPLAAALCRLGMRFVVAERACAYAKRGDALVRIASVSTPGLPEAPLALPLDDEAARAALKAAFGDAPLAASRLAMPDDLGGGEPGGLLAFARPQPFEKNEHKLVDALVSLAALAIRNVVLYEQSTRANRALAESNAFKDDLMAMFAHDFKGPLTVISGYSELLFDVGDPTVRRNAQTIVDQTRRLAKLSEDALALAATQSAGFSLQRASEDLAAFVRATIEPLDPSGERLAFSAPDEPVVASFDRSRLRHVIDNVVGNALKYSTATVAVRVEPGPGRAEARIVVADRGIGIPEAERDRIFSRFGRATNARSRGIAGSGVGLYIAKKIVDVHGGRVDVASVENEGSTFTIVLPAGP
jgi:signal transduction histidine kinase